MAKNDSEKMLTEVELELMNILWRLRQGTVADVIEALPAGRDLAYTSVSTMLRILEQKGILTAQKEGRGHLYIPKLSKEKYEARTVRHVVEKVFDGTPMQLVKALIDVGGLTDDDLKDVKELLKKHSAGKARST